MVFDSSEDFEVRNLDKISLTQKELVEMGSDADLDLCAKSISRLERCSKVLFTLCKDLNPKKSNLRSIQQQVDDELDAGNKLVTEIWKILKAKKKDRNLEPGLRLRVDKLAEEFGDAGSRFEEISRKVLEQRKSLPAQEFESPGDAAEAGAGSTQLEQSLLEDTDIQDMMITEKNQALRQMESELGDLHAIFKDVATLVNAQQEGLDSIESAVNETSVRVTAGCNELVKAKRNQARARKRMCCLVVTGSVVVVMLVYWILGPFLHR